MSKFQALQAYETPLEAGYKLLPFNFTKLRGSEYVMTNQAGEYLVMNRPEMESFVRHQLDPRTTAYQNLKSKHFLIDADSSVAMDLLPLKIRTKLHRLADFTSLHIFVVSLRCEHSCPYCQVSRKNDDKGAAFDMTRETADKALAVTFRSPSPTIKCPSINNFICVHGLTR